MATSTSLLQLSGYYYHGKDYHQFPKTGLGKVTKTLLSINGHQPNSTERKATNLICKKCQLSAVSCFIIIEDSGLPCPAGRRLDFIWVQYTLCHSIRHPTNRGHNRNSRHSRECGSSNSWRRGSSWGRRCGFCVAYECA